MSFYVSLNFRNIVDRVHLLLRRIIAPNCFTPPPRNLWFGPEWEKLKGVVSRTISKDQQKDTS